MRAIKANLFEIIFIFLIGIMFCENIRSWVINWMDFDSFYAAGFFMLAFSVYLVKKNYKGFSAIKPEPAWYGVLFLLFGLVLYVVGNKGDYEYIANASFPFFMAGSILCLRGKEFFLTALFPLIIFTSAIPVFPLNRITMPFQLISARATTLVLSALGLNAANEGNIILLESHRISVVAGCSGLKSLYSLFFICLIYSYFINTGIIKKIFFVAASIPLALFMNIMRILAVSFYVLYNGEQHAESFHDSMGMAVYFISIILIVMAARALENNED